MNPDELIADMAREIFELKKALKKEKKSSEYWSTLYLQGCGKAPGEAANE